MLLGNIGILKAKAFFTLCLMFAIILLSGVPGAFCAEENDNISLDVIRQYQEHRKVFVEQQRGLEQQYTNSKNTLEEQIRTITASIGDEKNQIEELSKSIGKSEKQLLIMENIRSVVGIVVIPLATVITAPFRESYNALSANTVLLIITLSVTVLNLTLVFLFGRVPGFRKKSSIKTIAVVAVAVALICTMAGPLFADELSQREEVLEQLEFAEKVLSFSEYERFIAILESGVAEKVDVPALDSGNPLLKVYTPVHKGSPQYEFTLAALYTHENKIGKAVKTIGGLTERRFIPSSAESDSIIANSVKFLIEQKHTELASKAIENLGDNIENISILIDLATFLQKNGMQGSADRVLSGLIARAGTTENRVKTAEYFFGMEKSDKGSEALLEALKYANSIDDILIIAKVAITYNKDTIVTKLVNNVPMVSEDDREKMVIVDMFLDNGRQEDAIQVFSKMIAQIKRNTDQRLEKLLFLMEAALQRNMLAQALSATNKLSASLRAQKFDFVIPFKDNLQNANDLPNRTQITLPLFFGLLQEELNFHSEAESVYSVTVSASLAKIIQSYGNDLPASLNDYHLLGRMWLKDNRTNLLSRLDDVYNILEEQFLKVQAGQYEESLNVQQAELETLRKAAEKTTAQLEYRTTEAAAKKYKVLAHTVSIYAIIAFLIVNLLGCGVMSWKYSRNMLEHKTFALVTRFLELTGWLRLMSILAGVSGLASILIAQLFQIVQKIHENSSSVPSLAVEPEIPSEPETLVVAPRNQEQTLTDQPQKAPAGKIKSLVDGFKLAMKKSKPVLESNVEPIEKTEKEDRSHVSEEDIEENGRLTLSEEDLKQDDRLTLSEEDLEQEERLTLSEEDLELDGRITLTVTDEDLESVVDQIEAKEDAPADSEPIAARSDWDESPASEAEIKQTQRERS